MTMSTTMIIFIIILEYNQNHQKNLYQNELSKAKVISYSRVRAGIMEIKKFKWKFRIIHFILFPVVNTYL